MLTPSKLISEILSLARADGDFLVLSKRLQMLHELNRDLFHKVVKQAKLGSRKAYYLVGLAKQLRGARLPGKRLEAIGWTKARIIAEHVDRHNALFLLALAEQHTARDLAFLVRGAHSSPPPTRCVLLYFNPRQYRAFEKAVVHHGAVRRGRGLVNKEQALVRLIGKASP